MTAAFAFDNLPRQVVLDLVKQADTPAEYKMRVMLARDAGHLSDAEAEDWIAMAGVAAA